MPVSCARDPGIQHALNCHHNIISLKGCVLFQISEFPSSLMTTIVFRTSNCISEVSQLNQFQGKKNSFMLQGLEEGTAESSGLDGTFDQLAGHLEPSHGEWLRKWLRLLTLEEKGTVERRAEIWSMPGTFLTADDSSPKIYASPIPDFKLDCPE